MSWLIDTALWTGALIAVALVLRRPVARLFGPGMAYALWALPLLRLVLPPIVLPALPIAPTPAPTVIVLGAPVPLVAAAPLFDWRPLLLALWLGGALLLLGWRLVGYWRMRARLLAGAVEMERRHGVRVVESPALTSPVAFGLIDRVVAMPVQFAGGDRLARELALAHELAHHRRGDLWANWAAQPLLALHWGNPLAWAGWRAMRRDQEAACDAALLAGSDPARRAAYGHLIATLAADCARPAAPALAAPLACPMLGEKSIVHRLRSLTMTEPSLRRRWLGRALMGGAVLALPLTATLSHAQPAPPAPPAAPAAPLAPEAPTAPAINITAPAVGEKKVVIIQTDHHDKGAEGAGHTVTVQRNGKTFVLTTDKELSPAEVDARIVKIEAEVAQMPPPPATPGAAGDAKAMVIVRQHKGAGEPGMHKMIIKGADIDGTITSAFAQADGEMAKAMGEACGKDKVTEIDAAGAEQRRVKLKLCHDGIRAHVVQALVQARGEIAAQTDMPGDIKAKVLKALDERIARQN